MRYCLLLKQDCELDIKCHDCPVWKEEYEKFCKAVEKIKHADN